MTCTISAITAIITVTSRCRNHQFMHHHTLQIWTKHNSTQQQNTWIKSQYNNTKLTAHKTNRSFLQLSLLFKVHNGYKYIIGNIQKHKMTKVRRKVNGKNWNKQRKWHWEDKLSMQYIANVPPGLFGPHCFNMSVKPAVKTRRKVLSLA